MIISRLYHIQHKRETKYPGFSQCVTNSFFFYEAASVLRFHHFPDITYYIISIFCNVMLPHCCYGVNVFGSLTCYRGQTAWGRI